MFDIKFSRQMKMAWVWLSLYLLSLTLLRLVRPTEPIELKVVLFVSALVNPAILLYLIRLVRHQSSAVSVTIEAPALSTWGYFWRSFILFFFQVPLLLLANLVVPLNLRANEFGALELAIWELPFAAISAVGAWLLYSKDRRGQIQLILTSVRGY